MRVYQSTPPPACPSNRAGPAPPHALPMDLGTVVTRRPDVRSRIKRAMALPMALWTVVTRRPDVRSRFRRAMALPMDLGTVVTRRPDVRGRFRRSGGRWHSRLPWASA